MSINSLSKSAPGEPIAWPAMASSPIQFSLARAAAPVLPLYISWLLMSLIGIVDLALASRVSSYAQAALGVADQILFLTMLAMSGLAGGVNSHISQALGANNLNLAGAYRRAGMVVTVIFGVLATLAGYCLSEPLSKLFCADQQAVKQASQYISICALANLPWAIIQCQGAIFRAFGQAELIAYQWLLITIIAAGGGIEAFFFLPGANNLVTVAIAWVIASLAGCVFGQIFLARLSSDMPAPDSGNLHIQIKDILSVGIPISLSEMSWLVSNLMLYGLIARLPDSTTAQAAWTIKLKVEETVAYAPLLAASMATATLVGHRVGARQSQPAKILARRLAAASTVTMLIAGCLTAVLAPYIVPIMTKDERIGKLSQLLLGSALLTYPLIAITNLLSSAFEGAGKTMAPMLINFTGFFLVRLPLAWIFMAPMETGIFGVLAAKVISCILTAAGMVLVFARASLAESNKIVNRVPVFNCEACHGTEWV